MKLFLITLSLILWGIVPVITIAETVSTEKLRLHFAYSTSEQPPYIYGNSKDIPENPGRVVDMLKSLEQAIPGTEIEFVRLPWKRCLKYLDWGKVDGIFNASFIPSRLQNGVYPMKDGLPDPSKQLVTISYGIYTLEHSPMSWDGEKFFQLNGLVGVNRGFSVIPDLQKMGISVEEVDSVSQNFLKLKLGRIKAVLAQNVTAQSVLKKDKRFKGIKKLAIPFKTKPYYLMLSHQFVKKHPKISERIWKEIQKIRETMLNDLVIN